MSFDNSADQKVPGGFDQPSGQAKTLVIGLGNPILGDDGIGWRVAEAIEREIPDLEVTCLSLGGLSLMERLVGYDRAIIIDSIQTREGKVGTVYTFPLEALPDYSAGHTTAAHDTSLQTALKVGRAMGASLPDDIFIVGVEAEHVYEFSDMLTPAVAQAVPAAVKTVIDLVTSEIATENAHDSLT